jgi:glycerol uptake facilitator protein
MSSYTLGQRFVAEMLAMGTVMAIGDGVIANEILKRTKGHDLGLGHVSVAFGMAFFVAILMFGKISATLKYVHVSIASY